MSGQWDADILMEVIAETVRQKDFRATEAGIRALATVDPDKAQDVLDMIRSVAELMIREEAP